MSWNLRNRPPRGGSHDRRTGAEGDRFASGADDAWYEPRRRAPAWQQAEDDGDDRAYDERTRARAQLDDVADALGRLMHTRGAPMGASRPRSERPAAGPQDLAPNRQARRAAAARSRAETRAETRADERPAARPADARTSRIEAVLSALDRLDRRVEDLSHGEPDDLPSGRGAAPLDDDGWDGAEAMDDGYGHDPQPRGRHARETRAPHRRARAPEPRPAHGHRAELETDYDDDAFETDAALEGDADWRAERVRPRPQPRRVLPSRAPRNGPAVDDLRPLFQDLARRIDGAAGPREQQLATLRGEIGELRAVLMESLRAERNRPQPRDTGEMRRLSDAVERLRADRPDPRLIHAMRDEIADLRDLIGRSNVDGMLRSLESGYAHLVQRLDELARQRLEPRLAGELADRLADIESAFRVVPRADQLAALDDRVADIGHRVEELVRRNGGEEVAMLRSEIRAVRDLVERIDVRDLLGGIDESIAALGQRLDAIDRLHDDQRAMADRLAAIERRVPQGGAIDRLNERLSDIAAMLAEDRAARAGAAPDERLDDRLDEIAGRLKRIEGSRQMPPSYDAAFTLLEKRLAAIDGKIDALDRPGGAGIAPSLGGAPESDLIARLESGLKRLNEHFEGGSSAGDADLGALRADIAALRDSVERPAIAADLEARLRDLADAASRGAGSSDTALLAQVEDKIAALAAKLDAAETGLARLDDLAGLPGSGDGAIAEALRGDLHRLMDAATRSEQRSRETMDTLQDVLASINERLQALEAGTAAPLLPEIEDTRPLEPGSGQPPRRRMSHAAAPVAAERGRDGGRLSAPAAPARDPGLPGASAAAPAPRPQAASPAGDPAASALRDRKADFIAAARRAAQAASEEADTRKGAMSFLSAGADAESGAGGWLRARLPGRRKVAGDPQASEPMAGQAPERTPEGMSGPGPKAADRRDGGRAARKGAAATDPLVAAADIPVEAPLAGDRGTAASGRQMFSSGGRRAVLLAAAAVVIALGALQIFKLVGPGSDTVADIAPPAAIEGTATPVASDGAPQGASDMPSAGARAPETAGAAPAPAEGARTAGENAQASAPQAPAGAVTLGAPALPAGGFSPVPRTGGDAQGTDGQQSAPGAAPATRFAAPPASGASIGDSLPASLDAPASGTLPGAAVSPAGALDAAALAEIPAEAGPIALRQAAAGGDPVALFAIAVRYSEGTDVQPDLAIAARYYEKAAAAGLAPAQYRLGSLYEKGRGVARDLETARDWYLRAAEQGNAKAAHNLAVLYAEGFSGTPEFRDAAYWFQRAAGFGLADSQYNLGILYARGLGLEKNLTESYKWFALAAMQGDTEAGKKRDEVANMLSREELADARLAVEKWTQAPLVPAANEVDLNPSWTAPDSQVSRASATVDPRELVANVQRLLAERGFDPGTPDGQIGPRTREAIRAYQDAAGLAVTGAVSQELLRSLAGEAI